MRIYLDDLRPCPEGWVAAKSYDEFVALIDAGIPDEVSFDHDLGGELHPMGGGHELTGYDCAKYLIKKCEEQSIPLPFFKCHSANPDGKKRILLLLLDYERRYAGGA